MKVAANSRITEPAFTWSMKKMRAVCVVTVVATPHIAWLTTGTFDRSFAIAARNSHSAAEGGELLHRVA